MRLAPLSRRAVIGGVAATPFGVAAAPFGLKAARAADGPIRIGELNSYGRMAAFAGPYRNAMQLAQDAINAAGGIKALGGRPIEFVFRDDGATPGDAVRVAEELLTRENVAFLCGTFLSNVGLAVADLANQRKVMFLATEPLTDALTLGSGNRYTFRVRPSTSMQTRMLVEAVKARGIRRWAIVAPNYEYGQAAAASFKRLMGAAVPGFEVVAEQYPALGRIDAGSTVGALAQARAEGLFNVLFAADLTAFVREGNTRGLFEGRTVASLLTGEPEYLIPLGDETPEGWITTGYPWETIATPGHRDFVAAYRARFNDTPRQGSLLGTVVVQVIRDLLEAARSVETEAMVAALEGLTAQTVVGPVTMRALDHQSTLGTWIGETALDGRRGTMRNVRYADGADYMVPEAEVRAARKA
ncbi:ABC transporter substrate-binding protein [Methylobacterium sp. JK268]